MDTGPLGPSSLAWRAVLSDWRGMLVSLWAGSMQNMHPGLGAGVEEHSRFFDERWERLFRSLYPIAGVVDAARTTRGTRLRGVAGALQGPDLCVPATILATHQHGVLVN